MTTTTNTRKDLLALIRHTFSKSLARRAVAECITAFLPYWEREHPNDRSVRNALEATHLSAQAKPYEHLGGGSLYAISQLVGDAANEAGDEDIIARAAQTVLYTYTDSATEAMDRILGFDDWEYFRRVEEGVVPPEPFDFVALLQRTWLPTLGKDWAVVGTVMVDVFPWIGVPVKIMVPALPYSRQWPIVVGGGHVLASYGQSLTFTYDEILESPFAIAMEDLDLTPARPVNL